MLSHDQISKQRNMYVHFIVMYHSDNANLPCDPLQEQDAILLPAKCNKIMPCLKVEPK